MLTGEFLEEFDVLCAKGMMAEQQDNYATALDVFETAAQLALGHDDRARSLDAIEPAAQALWSMGRYDEAADKLESAAKIAERLGLEDRAGLILSNMGRIAAVKTVNIFAVESQEAMLLAEATPRFREAYDILKEHPDLSCRYANARHGSLIAALAGDRQLALKLLAEGLRTALQVPEPPYDDRRTVMIGPDAGRGLAQMLVTTILLPMGNHTPALAKLARDKLVR